MISSVEGRLNKIFFVNSDTHYTIAQLAVKNAKSKITIVGYMTGICPGQTLKVSGSWITHKKYGEQFKVNSFEVSHPDSVETMQAYLESGIIKGIGPVTAGRIVKAFGTESLDIIENMPRKLTEIQGIGDEKAEVIHSSWIDNKSLKDIMAFLNDHGVKAEWSAEILGQYGESSMEVLKTDPFRLAKDLPSIGFVIADAITQKAGTMKDDPMRINACISYILSRASNEGHLFLPKPILIGRLKKLFKIDPESALTEIDDLIRQSEIIEEIISDEDKTLQALYLKKYHEEETGIAKRIHDILMAQKGEPLVVDQELLISEVHKTLSLNLSQEQAKILKDVIACPISIITGGPGTGKTTLIRSIKTVFEAMGRKVALAAPTGRAARRLAETTQREATTIHKLLGYNFKEDFYEKSLSNPIEADGIIIDEASMVDTNLMYRLMKATPLLAKIILVGDIFQLPSVGPGSVLGDIIKSQKIPVFYLSKIFRQAAQSPIVLNAHKVRRGLSPDLDIDDDLSGEFRFIEKEKPGEALKKIVNLCAHLVPEQFGFDPIRDIQVLAPMHKGIVGTINLNQALQESLNHVNVVSDSNQFRLGDKVMHLKNNYQKEIFNGDIGIVSSIERRKGEMVIDYDGRQVAYDEKEISELSLAYAISVHKSQGSEYPAVILPMVTEHYPLLQRNLLYTAMTRGRKLVIIVGTVKALNLALGNDKTGTRFTGLSEKIKTYIT